MLQKQKALAVTRTPTNFGARRNKQLKGGTTGRDTCTEALPTRTARTGGRSSILCTTPFPAKSPTRHVPANPSRNPKVIYIVIFIPPSRSRGSDHDHMHIWQGNVKKNLCCNRTTSSQGTAEKFPAHAKICPSTCRNRKLIQ